MMNDVSFSRRSPGAQVTEAGRAAAREATAPDTTALPDRPVTVQWNHAERLDGQRRPVDEEVPLRLLIRTTYPDGHAEDQTITGSIAVSIYYVGLMDEG
jgi:hypothetical protein